MDLSTYIEEQADCYGLTPEQFRELVEARHAFTYNKGDRPIAATLVGFLYEQGPMRTKRWTTVWRLEGETSFFSDHRSWFSRNDTRPPLD